MTTLTRKDELQLAAVAETIVKNTMEEYNEHLVVRNGVVDERRWKKIKQRGDMRVYSERIPSLDGVSTGASLEDTQSTSTNSYCCSEADMENTAIPMFAFGSVEGSLEDVMYGAISPTAEDMQLKTAYTEDGFVDWELLAQIITPSEHDPFRELSVKHVVKGHSLVVGAVVRRRSILYLESNGIILTPYGERIGYHLDHSVDVPGVHEQPGVSIVRGKISFCYLFRQRRANWVEVFVRGSVNPMGDSFASLAAFTSADVPIAINRNAHCAEMKKLTRILSSQPTAVRALVSSSSSASEGSSSSSGGADGDNASVTPTMSVFGQTSCGQCKKSIPSKLQLLRPTPKEKHCAMCGMRLCSSCRVYKTLFARSVKKEKELTQSSRAFCTSCLACVVGAWSATFAALDARAARGEDVDYASALSMS